jgi:glycosyltransferase involved in cell wall biosynthesis
MKDNYFKSQGQKNPLRGQAAEVRPKLLFLHRTQAKGVEAVHLKGMAKGFMDQGYELALVEPPGINLFNEPGKKRNKEAKPGFLARLWSLLSRYAPEIIFEIFELGYNFYLFKKVKSQIKKESFVIFYERYALNTFATAYLAGKLNLFFVLEVNDAVIIERTRKSSLTRLSGIIEKWVFRSATRIVTISTEFKKMIIDSYAVEPEKIIVLANAIEPERFMLKADRRLSRQELSLNSSGYLLGCAGAFVEWHGLDFLIDSVHDLLESLDVVLFFIGDGPVRKKIEQKANAHGVGERVVFTGMVNFEDVPYYLDLLDFVVIPDSNIHGSPMKLFESMAMAKPVIVPDYPPLAEVITNGSEGIVFSPGDKAELRKALVELVNNPDKARQMGKAGEKLVMKSHTWGANVKKLLFLLAKP